MIAAVSNASDEIAGLVVYVAIAVGFAIHFYRKRKARKQFAQSAGAVPTASPSVIPLHPTIRNLVPKRIEIDDAAVRREPIDQIRDLLGPVPRKFDKSLDAYLAVKKPAWIAGGDPIGAVYSRQQKVRRDGVIVWGVFVQVNQLNFKPGPIDVGGSVIFSLDPHYDANPGELQAMSIDLYALKGTDQADADAATFARMLTLESSRGMGLPVPPRFTGGRKVLHSSMIFPRKHLPNGFVTSNIFPVWVDPANSQGLLLVPAAYWPASLLAFWSRVPEPAPTTPAQPKQADE